MARPRAIGGGLDDPITPGYGSSCQDEHVSENPVIQPQVVANKIMLAGIVHWTFWFTKDIVRLFWVPGLSRMCGGVFQPNRRAMIRRTGMTQFQDRRLRQNSDEYRHFAA
ncbi:hypothetical protein [Oceaniglobus ichthyenteri]|uniref:hypothetical protein n=1 Tax=Oceaniglobus ichthyenteri TaxID=2136177 RepID=UPI000D39E130|nr:hypothetical protein [Oceaniglobus ichthyenteri]